MEEKEQLELLEIFKNDIVIKGVYPEAQESDKKALTYDEGGVDIASLWMCGRLWVTVSSGILGERSYLQMTCKMSCDDPTDICIMSLEGEFYQLLSLLQTTAKVFRTGNKVMKPGKVNYAGVDIG